MPNTDFTAYSEDKIASRFSEQHADRMKYCESLSKWFVWDGARWRRDETLEALNLIRNFVRDISEGAMQDDGPRRIASASGIAAIERLARSDPRHAVRAENLDGRPWEINTPAGTVSLKTGILSPHDPNALHTKVTLCSPSGECPMWLAFLHEIFAGDHEMVDYVQRVFGYVLTGVTNEQVFFFAHGSGGNGKSVVWNTLRKILKEYAYVAPPETFLASKFDRHPTELYALRGARFVISQETEANPHFSRGW